MYAEWIPDGKHASENTIGEWLKSRNNRKDIIISTKGGYYKVGTPHRLTESDIFSDLEGSLKRLKTDYTDIYWLHRDAPEVEAIHGEVAVQPRTQAV
jgi:aryl-alcohol dehydrogenase-like predicted oxidoreductase